MLKFSIIGASARQAAGSLDLSVDSTGAFPLRLHDIINKLQTCAEHHEKSRGRG